MTKQKEQDVLVIARIKRQDATLDFTRPRSVPDLMAELSKAVPVDKIYTFVPDPDGNGYSLREVGQVVLDIRLSTPPAVEDRNPLPTSPAPLSPPPQAVEPLASSPSEAITITPRVFGPEAPESNQPELPPQPAANNAPRGKDDDIMSLPTPNRKLRLAGSFDVIPATPEQAEAAAATYFKKKAALAKKKSP